MAMVPGWGMFNLNWTPGRFYAIMAVCGAVSGALMSNYRFAGLAGFLYRQGSTGCLGLRFVRFCGVVRPW